MHNEKRAHAYDKHMFWCPLKLGKDVVRCKSVVLKDLALIELGKI